MVGVGAKGSKCSTSFSGAATAAEGTVLEGSEVADAAWREFRVSKRVSASSAAIIIIIGQASCPLAQA